MGSQGALPRDKAKATSVAGEPSPGATSLIAKAGLATLLLTAAIAAGSMGLSQVWSEPHDDVAPAQAQLRLEAFHALDGLVAAKVSPAELPAALQGMQLDAATTQALRHELQPEPTPSTALSVASQALPAAQTASPRVRLVWIRLWDTDAEDGDVVRIDSSGYTRTVRLSKHGETFAVPVSGDGLIRVTGIKDGDGGGITVGLASGASQAVFPIMSEGQVLGLKVRVE